MSNTLRHTYSVNRHTYSDTLHRPASTDLGEWSVQVYARVQIYTQILRKTHKLKVESGNLRNGKAGSGGSALLLVLWVIMVLSLLIVSLTMEAKLEGNITSFYRNRTKAEYLARSGIELAELLMNKSDRLRGDKSEDEESEDDWHKEAKGLSNGSAVTLEDELGEGTITVTIVPEPARRNVNKLDEEDWERIFTVAGVPEDLWPELIESFYDWVDKDDNTRMDGAESEDYYLTLDPPYEARNAPLLTVRELLLVKWFNKAILSGGVLEEDSFYEEAPRCSGIEDMLTTYGDGKVNVNAASRRVLMTLPGVDDIVADVIIEEREGWEDSWGEHEEAPFEDNGDFLSRVPESGGDMGKKITTQSAIYRITSVGTVNGVARSVWCVASHSDNKLKYLRWREQD